MKNARHMLFLYFELVSRCANQYEMLRARLCFASFGKNYENYYIGHLETNASSGKIDEVSILLRGPPTVAKD